MPEIADPPPAPTSETINPKLRALFDVNIPEGDDPPAPAQPDPAPAPANPEPETPAPAPAESKIAAAKPDIASRLAPDFEAKKPAETPVPDAELVELDQAIAAAPTEKAKVDLRKFRDQLATYKEENRVLKSKPAALPEDGDTKTLLTTVTKERDELLARVERANLFESPKFQQEHLAPRQKQFDRLQGLVKESGGDPGALTRAISMTDKGRIDALDEIRSEIGSDMLKGQFDRLVQDIDARTAEINEKVRNAKQTAQELRQAELVGREEQHAQITKEFEGLLSHALRDTSENIMPELFTKVDDPNFAWWNEAIERDNQVAREALLESTPQKAAYAAVFASKVGTLLQMWRAERAANKAKDQEIAELKGAEPTLTADRKAAATATDSEPTVDNILSKLQSGGYRK